MTKSSTTLAGERTHKASFTEAVLDVAARLCGLGLAVCGALYMALALADWSRDPALALFGCLMFGFMPVAGGIGLIMRGIND